MLFTVPAPKKNALWQVILLLGLSSAAWGMRLDFAEEGGDDGDIDERLLIIPANGLGLNLTQLAFLSTAAASALLSLIGLVALGMLLFALLSQHDSYGSSGYGGYGAHSSYASNYRRSSSGLDWEGISILDWIAIGEDIWNNFDPADLECQKRVICELHQNRDNFGPTGQMITKYFSYLEYVNVFSIPEEVKSIVQEYLDAADRGRTLHKDCGEMFSGCVFSVKKVMEKYHRNMPATPEETNSV